MPARLTLSQAIIEAAVRLIDLVNSDGYRWVRDHATKELMSTDFSIIPITQVYVDQVFDRYLGEYRRANSWRCFHSWILKPSFTEMFWICKECGELKDLKDKG